MKTQHIIVIGSILTMGVLSSSSIVEATGTQQKQTCQTSPLVQQELNAMDQSLSSLRSMIHNACTTTGSGNLNQQQAQVRSNLDQLYLQMLSMSVDDNTFVFDFKRFIDADDNHALAHDMKLYKQKLDQFDALAKQAVQACDQTSLLAIKEKKSLFYNGDTTKNVLERKGYRALRQAEKPNTYFFQNGYYTKDSPHACNEPQFEFPKLKDIWTNLVNTWKNFKEAERQIKPRDSDTLFNEFLQKQGLMTVEDANKQLSGCGGKNTDNSYKTFYEHMTNCLSHELISKNDHPKTVIETEQELQQQSPTHTVEDSLRAQQIYTDVYDTEKLREDRRNRYYLLYNRRVEPIDQQLQGALVQTLKLMKGNKQLCDYTKQTATYMATFCEKVEQNKPGVCDIDKFKNESCN
jgi:hypothetical protein